MPFLSKMDNHRESRKRLRPWLERMIESSKCPGLVWENKEERTFQIPWRHFNNKDWVERDSQIFMEWAKYTGKYHDGDKMEYPVWKTRLRCALKKIPEIKELSDQHHLEDPDPYRVYQFVDVPVMKKFSDIDSDYSASPGSSTSLFTNSPTMKDYLEDSMVSPPHKFYDDTFLAPKQTSNGETYMVTKQTSNVPTVVYDDDSFSYNNLTVKTEGALYPPDFVSMARETSNCLPKLDDQEFRRQYTYANFNITSDHDFLSQMPSTSQNYSDLNIISSSRHELLLLTHGTSSGGSGIQPENESMKASLPSDLMSVESSDLCCPTGLNDVPSLSSGLYDSSCISKVDDVMQLTLRYGFPHNTVLQTKVAVNGCRLYFGAPQLQNTTMDEELFGPKTVSQIEMPDAKECSGICDEQRGFICELLDSMERGVVLTCKDGNIYTERLCRTRVFISDGVSESRLLERKKKSLTKVFDFAAFKASFENSFVEKTTMPKHYFFLTFGQEVKKDRSEPMGHVLIYVQVVHLEALHYVSQLSMADCSHGFSPLMSSYDTNDQLLQGFKNMNVKN